MVISKRYSNRLNESQKRAVYNKVMNEIARVVKQRLNEDVDEDDPYTERRRNYYGDNTEAFERNKNRDELMHYIYKCLVISVLIFHLSFPENRATYRELNSIMWNVHKQFSEITDNDITPLYEPIEEYIDNNYRIIVITKEQSEIEVQFKELCDAMKGDGFRYSSFSENSKLICQEGIESVQIQKIE